MFGQDKPLISPRDPDSLAQVGFSPLTGAGNPWLWQPQIRVEQRFALSNDSGLRAAGGRFPNQHSECQPHGRNLVSGGRIAAGRGRPPASFGSAGAKPDASRSPAAFTITAITSATFSLPSECLFGGLVLPAARRNWNFPECFSMAGMYRFWARLPPGFTVLPNGQIVPVRSNGGWAQIRIPITSRLAFNIYGGQQVNRDSDLVFGNIRRVMPRYFGNFMYRLAPNVIVSLEGGQVRTTYYQIGNRLNDHYDLAIAYLF